MNKIRRSNPVRSTMQTLAKAHKPGLFRALLICGSMGLAASGHAQEPMEGLSERDRLLFQLGQTQLESIWEPSPSETVAFDGLGPLFGAVSCADCHPAGGGGAAPQVDSEPDVTASRLTVAIAPPDPIYGEQLQPFGIEDSGEGLPLLKWTTNADGLTSFSISLSSPGYGDLAEGRSLSGRIAPPLHGLGLLEAVPQDTLLALADPDDTDNDGISGTAARAGPAGPVGRFGWQARQATLASQTMHALSRDMGLSSALFGDPSGECTAAQAECRSAPHGAGGVSGPYEVPASVVDQMVAGVRLSAPPRTEILDGEGAALFERAGCAACHIPDLPVKSPRFSLSRVAAYTDLLLHDMGDGLAVKTPDGEVISRDWRTAPLWGLSRRINTPDVGFLHDGRAKTIAEAIRWHGGEGDLSRSVFEAFDELLKDQLISFVSAL